MFLILAALLFSLKVNDADTGASQSSDFDKERCINITKGEITAEAGLCVVLPCSFSASDGFKVKSITWYKCRSLEGECDDIMFNSSHSHRTEPVMGRVSLSQPDLTKNNCSLIIDNLTESDTGAYQVKINGILEEKEENIFTAKANIAVKALTQKPTVTVPPLTEGQQTTLTCTAPGLCPGSDPHITWTWRGAAENDSHITGNVTTTQRRSSSLTFTPSAKHHGTEVTCEVIFTGDETTQETVTLDVSYIKITGNLTVKEGDALNLTCVVKGFGRAIVKWTKHGSRKNLSNNAKTKTRASTLCKSEKTKRNECRKAVQQNPVTLTSLLIPNITAQHSGRYICTAKHQNTSLITYVDVNVLFSPIFSISACEKLVESGVVTCVCVSVGFPLPTVRWPLLETHSKYAVVTTVSNHTVNSTVTLTTKNLGSSSTVECVSSNDMKEVKRILSISEIKPNQKNLPEILKMIQEPPVIFSFLVGILLSASICCLARLCNRKKTKNSGNLYETLEMVTAQAVPPVDAGQVEDDPTRGQEVAEGEGAEASGQSEADGDVEAKQAEYSDINFSLLQRQRPAGAEETRATTETEYAEIKRERTEDARDNGEEGAEMKEVMSGEDEEEKQLADEERGEDVALYSNLNEINEK